MYNNPLKVPILQEVSYCSYPPTMKDYIVNAVIESMGFPYKEQQPKYMRKKVGNDTIIMVWYSMSIPFGQKKYNVPINIYFMKNMPYEPPQIFIEVVQGSAVNPKSREIDQQTHRIMTPSLLNWSQYSTFTSVMEEMRQCFMNVFPIYKKQPNQTTIQQPNMYGQQQGGYVFQGAGAAFNRTTSFYGQAMAPPKPNMTMSNPQQSIYGVPQQTNNIYGNGGMNMSNIPKSNANMNYSQYQTGNPEDEMKNILINEAREKVEAKYLKVRKTLCQQNMKLKNYQNQFGIESEKINNYLMNKDQMLMASENALNDISNQVYNLTEYNNANRGKTLSGDNFMSFLKISDNDQKAIALVAKEAYYEEMLTLCKKGFEKQNIPFVDAVKFTRNAARDLFSVRYKREKMLNHS